MAFVNSFIGIRPHVGRNRRCVSGRRCQVKIGGTGLRVKMSVNMEKPETMEAAWKSFADKMKQDGCVPDHQVWHELLEKCVKLECEVSKAIWILDQMRATGKTPTAISYDLVMELCRKTNDRDAAFSLVEKMYGDKVLIGDVEMPDGMEDMLRKILPPEAFE